MPSKVTVVHLSEAEQLQLKAAAAAAASKQVADEIAAALKAGDQAIQSMATSREVTAETVGAALKAGAAKETLLQQLPAGQHRDALLAELGRTRAIILECQQMLTGGDGH